ncbi:permease prefix domain 1-containing protein [Micromonospora soli]|uniref:permease prefix domain 1-containing protein n=1 Tax=Micromonospora sp. NBRC 110009 TaxID=3061627 RepID=UPI002671E135|nr:permease prefix domain 1-containing protein [Micromonospora sp. NBRC 110009]WKT98696.1 permease prefix domain 1-containing protein [Micromonospora sp. NBRC 110009]
MASDHLTLRAATARLDAYLSDLAAGLYGPRRRREEILAELRDGLDHAITDHMTAGLPERDAVTAAIAQFGTPQAVADAFAGELATAYARRTIAWYIGTGPLVGIWWLLLLQPHPWHTSLVALLAAIPAIPLIIIAIATAAGAFATTGRLMRWLPEASPLHALAATTTIAALALAGDVIVIATYARSDLPAHSLALFAIAASLTRIAASLVTMRHATKTQKAMVTVVHDRPPTA